MATGQVASPAPAIWRIAKGLPNFAPPFAAETLVHDIWTPAPDLLRNLSDASDRTGARGKIRLSLPYDRLVIVLRGRGDPSGLTLGGLSLNAVPLGLDAAQPPAPSVPVPLKGYHPYTARTDAGGLLVLETGLFTVSQILVRIR